MSQQKSLNVSNIHGSKKRFESSVGRNLAHEIRFSEASMDFKEYTGLTGLEHSESSKTGPLLSTKFKSKPAKIS